MNQPLALDAIGRPDYRGNYGLGRYLTRMLEGDPDSEAAGSDVLMFVTFSGGGKRSAAFGHGALRGLRAIPLRPPSGREANLLQAVDYMAGVSGGSFPAAHYGLHRERSFATFPDEFLRVDINAYIWGIYMLPWNWAWLADPLTGTNDFMARVYDRLMFRGATYADLLRAGPPIISVNATDITNGTPFSFLAVNFGLLCSDLNSFPIARAVAASNGFPGLFSPVTIRSHAGRCGGWRPELAVSPARGESEGAASRRAALSRLEAIYADPEVTRWVHLMDGGIADNLAMRGLLNFFVALQADHAMFRRVALRTRRILVLSVDGQAATPRALGQQRMVGGLLQVLSAASGTQIDAYNFETLSLAREQVRHLADQIRTARCEAGRAVNGHPCEDVRGELVHLSLSDIRDPAARERLSAIPTGLTIPDADVEALLGYGEALVRGDPTLRAVAAEAGFPPPAVPAALVPGDRTPAAR